jgi:hypothetical protein
MKVKILSGKFLCAAVSLFGLLTLFAISPVQSQEPPDPDVAPEQLVVKLLEQLDLTIEQSEMIDSLLNNNQAEVEDILANYGLSADSFKALQEELNTKNLEFMDAAQEILTELQMHQMRCLLAGYEGPGHSSMPPPKRDDGLGNDEKGNKIRKVIRPDRPRR